MPIYQLSERKQVHPDDLYTLVIERVYVAALAYGTLSDRERETVDEVAYFRGSQRDLAAAAVDCFNTKIWRSM